VTAVLGLHYSHSVRVIGLSIMNQNWHLRGRLRAC